MKKIIQLSLIFTIIGSVQNLFATKNGPFDLLPKPILVKIALETDLQTIGRLHQTSKKTNKWLKDHLKVEKEKGQAVKIYSYEGYTGYEKHFKTFRECMEESKKSFKNIDLLDKNKEFSPTEKFFIKICERCEDNIEFGEFLKYILPHYQKGNIFYNHDLFKFQRTVINPLFEELLQKPEQTSWKEVFQENSKTNGGKNHFHYPTSLLALQFFFDKGISVDCPIKGNDRIDRKIIASFRFDALLRKNNPLCNSDSGGYVPYSVIQFLLNKKADVNECFLIEITQDWNGVEIRPLLLDAIKRYQIHSKNIRVSSAPEIYKLIELLLEYGADTNALLSGENTDKTIYDWVLENQNSLPRILELMEKYRK